MISTLGFSDSGEAIRATAVNCRSLPGLATLIPGQRADRVSEHGWPNIDLPLHLGYLRHPRGSKKAVKSVTQSAGVTALLKLRQQVASLRPKHDSG